MVDEAAATFRRTSFSTLVREANDFAVVLTDERGRSLAQSTMSIPSFIGTLPETVKHFLRKFPADTLKPDDYLITNDPWQGSGHVYDVSGCDADLSPPPIGRVRGSGQPHARRRRTRVGPRCKRHLRGRHSTTAHEVSQRGDAGCITGRNHRAQCKGARTDHGGSVGTDRGVPNVGKLDWARSWKKPTSISTRLAPS